MNFNKYADYYDLFYKKKNYSDEVRKIHKIIKLNKKDNILEVGCGTGQHSIELAKYVNQIHAIDKSEKMIKNAKKKVKKLKKANKKIIFNVKDIVKLSNKVKYDKIIMLFHVFSYFVDDLYLKKVFKKLNNILNPAGYIIFDCWNYSYVNKYGLSDSSREIELKNYFIKRLGKLKKIKKNIYLIQYIFQFIKKNKIIKTFSEKHKIRTFSYHDIKKFSKSSFKIKKLINLNSLKKVSEKDFSACVILKKV